MNNRIKLSPQGFVEQDGRILKIVLTQDLIQVGCNFIEPKVFEYILEQYKKNFSGKKEIVLQDTTAPIYSNALDPHQFINQGGSYSC